MYNVFRMKHINIIIIKIIVFCTFICTAVATSAQMDISGGNSQYDDFNTIKSQITSLVNKNVALLQQQELLKQQLSTLQKRSHQQKKELKKTEQISRENTQTRKSKQDSLHSNHKSVGTLENDKMILESKINFLSKNLLDFTEKEKILKLQLSNLQYEKRELEINAKWASLKKSENQKRQQEELNYLQQKLEDTHNKKNESAKIIAGIKKNENSSPKILQELKQNNQDLDYELLTLQKKKNLMAEKIAHLAAKQLSEKESFDQTLKTRNEEKNSLKEEVKNLEKDHNSITKKVHNSLSKQKQKRQLLDKIIHIDKENQELRQELQDLKKQTKDINNG